MSEVLTVGRVESALNLALFREDELSEDSNPPGSAIKADAIVMQFAFHPERLKEIRCDIARMLLELEDPFFESVGGGWSFLNACNTRDGRQWTGEHRVMGILFALGQACGLVSCPWPREFWGALPGGMPYYCVKDEECRRLLA